MSDRRHGGANIARDVVAGQGRAARRPLQWASRTSPARSVCRPVRLIARSTASRRSAPRPAPACSRWRSASAIGPNLAARYLQSSRQLRISVQLPRQIALFWDLAARGHPRSRRAVCAGAARRLQDVSAPRRRRRPAVRRPRCAMAPTGSSSRPATRPPSSPISRRRSGAAFPSSASSRTRPRSSGSRRSLPNPFTVGAVAGELMARFLPAGGEVAFFTGWLATQDHADKLRGFESSLESMGPRLRLGPVVEAHDDEREGHRRALKVLRSHPGLKGIYVSTVNSPARAARRRGRRASRGPHGRHDRSVSGAGRMDSRRQGGRDRLSAAGEPGTPGAAGALSVPAQRHATAVAPPRCAARRHAQQPGSVSRAAARGFRRACRPRPAWRRRPVAAARARSLRGRASSRARRRRARA